MFSFPAGYRGEGAGVHGGIVPFVQDVLRDGVKTLVGIDRLKALPRLLCRDEARMRPVGFKAQQVRQGICQRGATTRQGQRLPGPIGPATLAKKMVPWKRRNRDAGCKGAIRALAQAGGFGGQVPGMADGTDRETTERSTECGQCPGGPALAAMR